jgi:hypothetical protein
MKRAIAHSQARELVEAIERLLDELKQKVDELAPEPE